MTPVPILLLGSLGAGPCPALPLRPGTAWTYQVEVAWAVGRGDSVAHARLSWTTTVLAVRGADSVVAATVLGWPTDLAWWAPGREPSTALLYCLGSRVYLVPAAPQTVAALADSLVSGTRRPSADQLVLQFPLRTGDLFGRAPDERQDTFYAWFVESAEPVPPAVRRLQRAAGDSLYMLVYRTNPDHTSIGFVPGLGVARYAYRHHGTPADAQAALVGFRLGTP